VTTEEFGMGWKLLIEYYADQRKDLSDDERIKQRNIYFKFLKDMDGSLWQEVVGVAIQSSNCIECVSLIKELMRHLSMLSRQSDALTHLVGDRCPLCGTTWTARFDPLGGGGVSLSSRPISLAGIARSSSPPGKEPTGSESGSGWSETPWGRRLIMDSERFDKLLNGRWVVGSPTQPPGREC
jgi:hypothetical protein